MGKNFEALREKANKQVEIITAAEARKLADESNVVLKRIFKLIAARAAEGITTINWDTKSLSKVALSKIENELAKAGYVTEMDYLDTDCLIISW